MALRSYFGVLRRSEVIAPAESGRQGGAGLCLHCCHQRLDANDVHDPGQVIGQDVQGHLGAHVFQPLHQEMGRAHPGLDDPEGMLDGLAPLTHGLRVFVEPPLDGL